MAKEDERMALDVNTFESNDPYTLIESRLWQSIDRHQGLMDLIPENNRIRWNGKNEQPEKDGILPGDVPTLTIVPMSGAPVVTENVSQMFKDTFRWGVGIKSKSRLPCKNLFQVYWQFCKAVSKMGVNFMDDDDGNLEFVTSIDIETAQFGPPGENLGPVKQMGMQTWLMSAIISTLIHIPGDILLEDN